MIQLDLTMAKVRLHRRVQIMLAMMLQRNKQALYRAEQGPSIANWPGSGRLPPHRGYGRDPGHTTARRHPARFWATTRR